MIKFTFVLSYIIYYLVFTLFYRVVGHAFLKPHSYYRRRFAVKISRVLNLHLKIKNLSILKNGMVLSNHLSYLDILIYNALFEVRFITSIDMSNNGIVGNIIKSSEVFLIDRQNRTKVKKEIIRLKNELKSDDIFILFPEGTTSNGESVLKVKSTLLECIDQSVETQVFTINYRSINGEKVSRTNRDLIYWYGKMEFIPHLYKLCKMIKKLDVEIIVQPLKFHLDDNRKSIAQRVEKSFVDNFVRV